MANEMKTDQVTQLLKEAKGVAKSAGLKDAENPLVVIGVAQLMATLQRKEKKLVVPGLGTRPDPVQEARKTPRKPLMGSAPSPKKKATARKR